MDRMIFPTHEVLRQSQHMKRMSSRVEACSVALLRKTSQQARQSSVANCSKRGRAQVGFVSVLCSNAIFGRTLTIALEQSRMIRNLDRHPQALCRARQPCFVIEGSKLFAQAVDCDEFDCVDAKPCAQQCPDEECSAALPVHNDLSMVLV